MFNEYLINNILKNKVYFGDSGISKDMVNFVYAANNKGDRVVFDILKQVNQIRKVFLLLKGLKPVLKSHKELKEILTLNTSVFI